MPAIDKKRKYIVTIIPDNEETRFTESSCTCEYCKNMRFAQEEWKSFIPKNYLQKNMKKVIKKIEDKILDS